MIGNTIRLCLSILLGLCIGLDGLSGAMTKKKAKYVWGMGVVSPDAAWASELFKDIYHYAI